MQTGGLIIQLYICAFFWRAKKHFLHNSVICFLSLEGQKRRKKNKEDPCLSLLLPHRNPQHPHDFLAIH